MARLILGGVSTLGALLLSLPLRADTTSLSATEITSLPCTISAPGVYFLSHSLSVSGSQNGITVSVDGVTIDLNGCTISNLAGGLGASGAGIYDVGYSQLTVRNGIIRGFAYGVCATGSSSSGHLLENLRLLENTYVGACVEATSSVIRHCQASKIGGSTQLNMPAGTGFLISGSNNTVQDCDVSELTSTNATVATCGVYFATGNDLLALGNRINGAINGVVFDNGSTGKYRDNLCAASVTTPYTGGTNTGNN